MSADRYFGALIAHDGVTLVEYREERTGIRVAEQWNDAGRSTSIDEALARLASLIASTDAKRAHVALAVEQFGVLHHLMTLPPAADAVVTPIVKREMQRVFGVADPVVAFTRGAANERREPGRADERTAPRQMFVAGAPRAAVEALTALSSKSIDVEVATVVPKAVHALYEASGAALEPTAVLVCLESGPHLSFFLEGRLELAIDPPIALEGDRPTVPVILDQFERGAVYFRQQFRGASASRVLLAARADEYETLSSALESRLGVRVKPLFSGATTPEAVVAMGAVLESRHTAPLDIFPHPPTLSDRLAVAIRGPNAIVGVAAAAAILAVLWAGTQVTKLGVAKSENTKLRSSISADLPSVDPMRRVAEHRADVMKQASFVRGTVTERAIVARSLAAIAGSAGDGIAFDSVNVVRSANGWNGMLAGRARGVTTAQSVFALDSFLKSVRGQPGVSSVGLEDFSYPSDADTSRHGDTGPVIIQFRVSFALKPAGGAP